MQCKRKKFLSDHYPIFTVAPEDTTNSLAIEDAALRNSSFRPCTGTLSPRISENQNKV